MDDTTWNIEVRVGFQPPWGPGHLGEMFTINSVCGVFDGPGSVKEISSVNCTEQLEGRYVTLQTLTRYEHV